MRLAETASARGKVRGMFFRVAVVFIVFWVFIWGAMILLSWAALVELLDRGYLGRAGEIVNFLCLIDLGTNTAPLNAAIWAAIATACVGAAGYCFER